MKKLTAFLLALLLLTGCSVNTDPPEDSSAVTDTEEASSVGKSPEELGAYEGYFEGEKNEVIVECISGSANAYRWDGNVLTFTAVTEESVYAISGALRGNIVIDVGEDFKFELELRGLSLISQTVNPITVKSGDEVKISAKKGYKNYIYDERAAIDPEDSASDAGAIYAECDLEIAGKGALTVLSTANGGIHTKDDLQIKNLTLLVFCVDNALKGNDSVEIESGALTLIASSGDGIKTSNSDISSKGNQRGSIALLGGTVEIFAARDGIDAAYDVRIAGETLSLSVYTDRYSAHTAAESATDENSDLAEPLPPSDSFPAMPPEGDFGGGPGNRPEGGLGGRPEGGRPGGFGGNFGGNFGGDFGGRPDGFGGMQDGNTVQNEPSSKGIKAGNAIAVEAGTVTVRSHDDALHASADTALENGASPLGAITVSGGTLTLSCDDDGLHADGALQISGGNVRVEASYEGLEGDRIFVTGGNISIRATDDGINSTGMSDTGIEISGGRLYLLCNGDGMDANTRASYGGIVFSGGDTVIISSSGGNSAIDTENGYTHTGGTVLALMPTGGMVNEACHCENFESVGSLSRLSLTEGHLLVLTLSEKVLTVRIPVSLSAYAVVLGEREIQTDIRETTDAALDEDGVCIEALN